MLAKFIEWMLGNQRHFSFCLVFPNIQTLAEYFCCFNIAGRLDLLITYIGSWTHISLTSILIYWKKLITLLMMPWIQTDQWMVGKAP